MRVLLIILSILLLLVSSGMSGLLGARNSNEMEGMEQLESLGALGGLAEAMVGDELPSKGAWTTGMFMSFLMLIAGLFGIVSVFLSQKIGTIAAGAIVVLSLLFMILQPGIEPSFGSGANPKTLAIITSVIAIAGAACVYFSHKMKANQATA